MDIKITEQEFARSRDRQLQAIARRLQDTGLSISDISRIAHLKWTTVRAALSGQPVRYENLARLRLVCARVAVAKRAQMADKKTKATSKNANRADKTKQPTIG